jgi:hypothetical protein
MSRPLIRLRRETQANRRMNQHTSRLTLQLTNQHLIRRMSRRTSLLLCRRTNQQMILRTSQRTSRLKGPHMNQHLSRPTNRLTSRPKSQHTSPHSSQRLNRPMSRVQGHHTSRRTNRRSNPRMSRQKCRLILGLSLGGRRINRRRRRQVNQLAGPPVRLPVGPLASRQPHRLSRKVEQIRTARRGRRKQRNRQWRPRKKVIRISLPASRRRTRRASPPRAPRHAPRPILRDTGASSRTGRIDQQPPCLPRLTPRGSPRGTPSFLISPRALAI